MAKSTILTKSLSFKLVLCLFLSLGLLMGLFTWYQFGQIRERVEKDLEGKGFALAKSAAHGLEAMVKKDIERGLISKEALFDRDYIVFSEGADPKESKYNSAFDEYTDKYWQEYQDSFMVDEDVVFAIAVAYSEDPNLNGYVPTHNKVFKARSKRIFNDTTGAAAASTQQELKQVYKRDTGETMWDMSYPIDIEGSHWGAFRVAISIEEAEAKIAALQKQTLIMMTVVLLAISIIILVVSKIMVSRPLGEILRAAQNLTSHEADFTYRLEIKTQDELGELARTFNIFMDKIQVIMKNVTQSIEGVAVTSSQLKGNAGEVAQASQSVAMSIEEITGGIESKLDVVEETQGIISQFTDAIDQIAGGAAEQANHVHETSNTISVMDNVINSVAADAKSVLEAAIHASEAAQKGERAVKATVAGMEKIKGTVFESAQKIKALGEQSEKIGEIIQVIDEIAEQTNLLALNAAIEAARAGDHGKGFAVVADEVRKLAERSGTATKEIALLVNNIRKGTVDAVEAMENGTTEVEEGVHLAYDAGEALVDILQNVESTLNRTKSISSSADDMKANSSLVVTAMNNVAAITEENSAATQQMAAGSDNASGAIERIAELTRKTSAHIEDISVSVEEMAASTEDVAQSADNLATMAENLRDMVKGFKL